jgi:hypothetical protein
MSLKSLRTIAVLLGCLLAAGQAPAANGDLLGTFTSLSGKNITGICADSDGTFWALGETSGKIYHLDGSFAKIGEIANPHGVGVFPNLILSRGIAFRPATHTLLVMAKDAAAFKVREVDTSGVEVLSGAFSLDTSALTNPNLYGFAYDSLNDQVWLVDDNNDLVIQANLTGASLNRFDFPRNTPPETTLRGTGISFLQSGAIPYIYITYGDIFTLAPSRVLELTASGAPTGVEVPLQNVPSPDPTVPVKEIGALLAWNWSGKSVVVVTGQQGLIHVIERVRPDPIPPSFLQARVSRGNQVILSWTNNGGGVGGSYQGGISITRGGSPLANVAGGRTEYTDDNPLSGPSPPPNNVVTYTVRGSNGGPLSWPSRVDVLVGKGGLIRWTPFPGKEPYDLTRNTINGDIYVTDTIGGQIFRFDKDMVYLGQIPSPFTHPGGIAFNPSGNGGTGLLMVADTEGVLVREIDLLGNPLDLRTPVDFGSIATPHMGGLAYDAKVALYTCVETSTRQLVSFDRNGRQKAICTPPEIFTKRLSEGLAFDPLTGNFHATFEDNSVRELYKSCAPTNFSFDLGALGQTSYLPNFTRGIAISDNTLLVAAPKANAIFQVLIFPQGQTFIRGDLDQDGAVRITDAVVVAEYLFKSGPPPFCLDAADANDDGELDISDPVYLLFFLFLGGPAPPPPYPTAGTDPTFLDNLEC